MTTHSDRTARHWDRHARRDAGRTTGLYWYELPGVLAYISRRISGEPDVDWVQYTVGKYFAGDVPAERCLSLGCGTGHLERQLARLKAFRGCDAYDLSPEAVATARRLAAKEGYDGQIRYHVADVNQLELPEGRYDAAWCYGSLHHFHALEHVLDQIQRCLKPRGLLVFNEYVGPSRFQFPARQKEVANRCLELLPLRYRRVVDEALLRETEKSPQASVTPQTADAERRQVRSRWSLLLPRFLRSRDRATASRPNAARTPARSSEPVYREEVGFPSVEDVLREDPSESPRSGEVLQRVRTHFEFVEETHWGGNIPQFLLSGIAGNFQDDDPCAQALLEMIWTIDSTLIQCGEFKSDFAYVVARPLPSVVLSD